MHCAVLGIPTQDGTHVDGCLMGPDALRVAGLDTSLISLGHDVTDLGNLARPAPRQIPHPNENLHHLGCVSAWIENIQSAALHAASIADMPVFLGGDHCLSAGTVPAMCAHAETLEQPQFVLWLDAHADLHSLDTTKSGNLHGTPLAYSLGLPGFEGYPDLPATLSPENTCIMGLRSVDVAERAHILDLPLQVHDMRDIDEHGIIGPLRSFLERVEKAKGRLHVSFDVDFIDPEIACAVGTTVPGGATFREAHLVMELLCDSGLVTSLDLAELNPALDDRGKTARLLVDLAASLMGRTVLDKPTFRF